MDGKRLRLGKQIAQLIEESRAARAAMPTPSLVWEPSSEELDARDFLLKHGWTVTPPLTPEKRTTE